MFLYFAIDSSSLFKNNFKGITSSRILQFMWISFSFSVGFVYIYFRSIFSDIYLSAHMPAYLYDYLSVFLPVCLCLLFCPSVFCLCLSGGLNEKLAITNHGWEQGWIDHIHQPKVRSLLIRLLHHSSSSAVLVLQ